MAERNKFLKGYATYNTSQGYGSPTEWKEAFRVRMGLDEANSVLGDEDPYSILGLVATATWTAAQIKKAYLRLAKRWHPDLNQGNEDEAERMFIKVQAAYVKLGGT